MRKLPGRVTPGLVPIVASTTRVSFAENTPEYARDKDGTAAVAVNAPKIICVNATFSGGVEITVAPTLVMLLFSLP